MTEPLDIEIEATLDTLRSAGFTIAADVLEREARGRLLVESDLTHAIERLACIEQLAIELKRAMARAS